MTEVNLHDEKFYRAADRALDFLNSIDWKVVLALDLLGWKIVPQDPNKTDKYPLCMSGRPWNYKRCPAWCDPSWKPPHPPRPRLRLIDGGKSRNEPAP
jgi:hypothetical protein